MIIHDNKTNYYITINLLCVSTNYSLHHLKKPFRVSTKTQWSSTLLPAMSAKTSGKNVWSIMPSSGVNQSKKYQETRPEWSAMGVPFGWYYDVDD